MDQELFSSVLRNLLHINVRVGTMDDSYLKTFEE